MPMALTNNNFIGYVFPTIVKYKVKWIEAAAAAPFFTSMICFYIDGDKGHLMEEELFNPQHRHAVRGNVFSYQMPWEKIIERLEATTKDKELALLPHDPEKLAHMVRLHLRVGSVDLAKHIPEIKLRAHVVLALCCDLIDAGHAAYVDTTQCNVDLLRRRMAAAKKTVQRRLHQHYPLSEEEARKPMEERDGIVPASVLKVVEESLNRDSKKSCVFDKHGTPAEGAHVLKDVFKGVRPQAVLEERTSDAGMDVNALLCFIPI